MNPSCPRPRGPSNAEFLFDRSEHLFIISDLNGIGCPDGSKTSEEIRQEIDDLNELYNLEIPEDELELLTEIIAQTTV